MPPSVLIVDDHPGFRESARALLEAEGFDVVGLAGDSEQAVAEARRLQPDLVLLDIQLPGDDGFAASELLSRLSPAPAVILTSSRGAAVYGSRIAEAPVRGFVAKSDLSGAALAGFLT